MPLNPCFETICVENRQLKNLPYHQERLNRTRRDLWGLNDQIELEKILAVPDFVDHHIHKCRLSYAREVIELKWEPYTPRTIRFLKKVQIDDIDYSYKYEDRAALNAHYAQRGGADEILIIKKGMVTDTSIGNVAFFKGGQWFTPATFLLPGTRRAQLLDTGIISEKAISEEEIPTYTHIKLFNAMNDWARATVLDIDAIV